MSFEFKPLFKSLKEQLPDKNIVKSEIEKLVEIKEAKSRFSARIPKEDINETYKTSFNFLKEIGSYQKGHLALILGRTNKGKSTLMLSLAIESAINGYKALIYLAEDKREDVEKIIELILSSSSKHKENKDIIREKILLIQNDDILESPSPDVHPWINSLKSIFTSENADILFFDNISSCPFGEASPSDQAEFIKYLRKTCDTFNFPIIAGIHPAKTTLQNKKLSLEDIRANSAFANSPSYIFALHNFCHNSDLRMIEIIKSRVDSKNIGKFFNLSYKKLKTGGFYEKDREFDKNSARNLFSINTYKKPTN